MLSHPHLSTHIRVERIIIGVSKSYKLYMNIYIWGEKKKKIVKEAVLYNISEDIIPGNFLSLLRKIDPLAS